MKPSVFSVCRLLATLVLAVGLSACNTLPSNDTGALGYTGLLDVAEADVAAGRVEAALVAFDNAAQADPTRKEPWLRTAQLQFDAGNYGRAIVAAQEVLQRDPTDLVADSVLTVSGLRIASESLQRLQGNGALASNTARAEAERLAATMRSTMGEDILDAGQPAKATTRSTSRRRAAPRRTSSRAATPATPAKSAGSGKPAIANPFGGLGS